MALRKTPLFQTQISCLNSACVITLLLLLISYHKAFLILLNISAQNPTSPLVGNDELSQKQASGYTFTRNLTTKGSRYAPKTPLKHIHASDGARLILDKFNNNNSQAPVCTSKQYYGE